MSRILTLLLLVAAVGAGELKAPLVFFRTPDPETRKEIRRLVSDGFDNTNRETRAQARAELVKIGPWAVPFLAESFRRSPQQAQNAAITIALIGDRAGLPALREAARKSNEWVGRTSCLALGHLGGARDLELLHGLMTDRRCRYRAAAALALAKLPGGGGVLATEELARDPHVAAAQVLGLAVAAPDHDLRPHLRHREPLVRLAAATGLLVRPLPAADAGLLFEGLDRPDAPKERTVRARLAAALAAIPGRTPEVRARLLKAARREKGREARVAALIGLAAEWNVQEQFKTLGTTRFGGDDDPLVGPLLFAFGRTGSPAAVDVLLRELRKEGDRPFYAAGSLLYEVCATRDGKEHPRALEITAAVSEVRDEATQPLVTLAKKIHGREWADQRRIASADFPEIVDPHGHHLWDWTPEDRAWASVNRFLPYLFALDDLADAGDPTKRDQGPAIGLKDDGEGKQKAASQGKPAEQDLLAFLAAIAYFGPEDLRGR